MRKQNAQEDERKDFPSERLDHIRGILPPKPSRPSSIHHQPRAFFGLCLTMLFFCPGAWKVALGARMFPHLQTPSVSCRFPPGNRLLQTRTTVRMEVSAIFENNGLGSIPFPEPMDKVLNRTIAPNRWVTKPSDQARSSAGHPPGHSDRPRISSSGVLSSCIARIHKWFARIRAARTEWYTQD